MNFSLKDKTIFFVLSGSRAYGLNQVSSDYDYRGIAIPPMDSYIGVLNKFEHAVSKATYQYYENVIDHVGYKTGSVEKESDMQVYELCKFVRLAADCNPSIIEVLFTDERHVIISHPIMEKMLSERNIFLSQLAKDRFCGYAMSQLQRIKRHKRWLDRPILEKPDRKNFGLPDHKPISLDQLGAAQAIIQSKVNDYTIDFNDVPEDVKINLKNNFEKSLKATWLAINPGISYPVDALDENATWRSHDEALKDLVAQHEGHDKNFLQLLDAEKRYQYAMKDYLSYQNWLKNRNPARSEVEKKHGFDLKHATHLVRLLKMAREILEQGIVKVFRDDAEELLSIRNGAWTYDQILEYAEKEDKELSELRKKSSLPKKPDMNKIHKLTHEMVLEFNK
jgi:uncharacterized protein